jgi:hypothetical protein
MDPSFHWDDDRCDSSFRWDDDFSDIRLTLIWR